MMQYPIHPTREHLAPIENKSAKKSYFWEIAFGLVIFSLTITLIVSSVKNLRLRHYAKDISGEIGTIYRENLELQREISALKNDPPYREKVLRDELQMGAPDEIIIKQPN